MRQIILDTETTGLDPSVGHRIIEIGCIELIQRRPTGNNYQVYLNPERSVSDGAVNVHGLTDKFLSDKPKFQDIVEQLLAYIKGAELIIHNAPFDVGFLDHELQRIKKDYGQVTDFCQVFDTLILARKLHPGRKNSLDALCKRYNIDNSERNVHGALLDAKLLSRVYLTMTGGQVALFQTRDQIQAHAEKSRTKLKAFIQHDYTIPVLKATAEELAAHQQFLKLLKNK